MDHLLHPNHCSTVLNNIKMLIIHLQNNNSMWFNLILVEFDPNNSFTKQLLLMLFFKRGNWSLARLYNMHMVKQSISGVLFSFFTRQFFFTMNWWLWWSNMTFLLSPVVAILGLLLHWLHSIYWAYVVYVNHIYSTCEGRVRWEIKLGSTDLHLKNPKPSEIDFLQRLCR